ncbi:hypothetical protein D3C85_502850 [compost metagenome]
MGPRRIDTGEHAGVGERNKGDGATADQDGDDISGGDPGNGECRQTLWKRAEDRHTGARGKIQHANGDRRACHGDQNARHALVALEQQDHRQGGCADHERGPVGLSIHHRRGDRP